MNVKSGNAVVFGFGLKETNIFIAIITEHGRAFTLKIGIFHLLRDLVFGASSCAYNW